MAGRSAAYIVVVVAVSSFIAGAFTITVVDPIMQAVFASPSYASSTEQGTDMLRWMVDLFAFVPAALLIGITSDIWVRTRQAA